MSLLRATMVLRSFATLHHSVAKRLDKTYNAHCTQVQPGAHRVNGFQRTIFEMWAHQRHPYTEVSGFYKVIGLLFVKNKNKIKIKMGSKECIMYLTSQSQIGYKYCTPSKDM